MTEHESMMKESLFRNLLLAITEGALSKCQSLIQEGAKVNGTDEYGNSPLMLAVSSPRGFLLPNMLIKVGAEVNCTNVLGETPLLNASWAGNFGTVKLLLKHGADPNVASKTGYTALMAAADNGHGGGSCGHCWRTVVTPMLGPIGA